MEPKGLFQELDAFLYLLYLWILWSGKIQRRWTANSTALLGLLDGLVEGVTGRRYCGICIIDGITCTISRE
jgi:hypothetical protein